MIYWISLIVPKPLLRLTERASRSLPVVYFIQWVIIRVMGDVVLYVLTGSSELSDLQIVACVPFVLALTAALTGCYNKIKPRVI
jgi:hypothetical protein